ncbi:MAG TPA: M28 family peptidase [Gaiellaceae bacterium]|nr:M28 family peptidase [Gaiellaceae bacterium]
MAVPTERRRPRRGSLERPISGRIYRAAWLAVAVPLLVAAFSVSQPVALQQPRLPPSFDRTTALQFATELARDYPDRRPGTTGARAATNWVAQHLRDYDFTVTRQPFTADVPGLGEESYVNLIATAPATAANVPRSQQVIAIVAHRDNLGGSPGADYNASGTGALLELARDTGTAALSHTLVLVSTDGDVSGALGAAKFARESGLGDRLEAVIDLDAIGGSGVPRLHFTGGTPRTPASTFVATAEASVEAQGQITPERPNALSQLIDLAFPFSLWGQAPFIAQGVPAVTLSTAAARTPDAQGDTLAALDEERMDQLGRSAQVLLASLDSAADVASGTESYIWTGSRLIRGWTIQFLLLACLLPFLAATVDLFARCRRRHIALRPALRSLASRVGLWAWIGVLLAFFSVTGIFPNGEPRPISPDSPAAEDWPVFALVVFAGLAALGWLVTRLRLVPTEPVARTEELGGHLAAMLGLAVVALVVAAQNPFALVFVLPSLHAWLWLPHASERGRTAALGLFAVGLLGPLLLLGSFAFRYGLGLDAIWYLVALTSVGFVPVMLVISFLAWGAAASQAGAVAAGRYAPYPAADERPRRGPIRESIRQAVLLSRRMRTRPTAPEERDRTEQADSD